MVCGCGGADRGDLPPTYEVHGIVLQADGQPLAGGNIEFTPKQPSGLKFMGIIAADGKFTAKTVGQGQAPGAPEGTYTAVVVLPTISTFNEFVELDEVLYVAVLFWLLMAGPGKASLDALLGRRYRR